LLLSVQRPLPQQPPLRLILRVRQLPVPLLGVQQAATWRLDAINPWAYEHALTDVSEIWRDDAALSTPAQQPQQK